METLRYLFDLVLHVDKHLIELAAQYGSATYIILFIVVFCETGLVVTPFLPGDSLLFAAGAIASKGSLDPNLLTVFLILAAVIGDGVNYHVGRYIGPKVLA